MIDSIWSGWRAEYVSRLDRKSASEIDPDQPSIFRRLLESGLDDVQTHIVHRGTSVFAVMNAHPYSVGHVLVLPYRQIAELGELSSEETNEIWAAVTDAVEVLRTVFDPDGFNIGINIGSASGGSVIGHLHVHVVPRWIGDANFTVTTASVKAIPEALDVTADKVRTAWMARENA